MENRVYGWKPDLPDHRDKIYKAPDTLRIKSIPTKVDLRDSLNPVPIEDQGQLGSCTANALAVCMEFLRVKKGLPEQDLSRLFIYYNERLIEGTVRQDSGAQIRDGVKSLSDKGVCQESLWPYVTRRFKTAPSDSCYREAQKHKAKNYYRIVNINEVKSHLADGYPVVFGFTVYSSFETDRVSKNGIVPMPKRSEECLGGHAVVAVGYDDNMKIPGAKSPGAIIVRNSWGSGWGDKGHFYMSYEYVGNSNLADDFWCITDCDISD
jgi:C1A family cysteine protease